MGNDVSSYPPSRKFVYSTLLSSVRAVTYWPTLYALVGLLISCHALLANQDRKVVVSLWLREPSPKENFC